MAAGHLLKVEDVEKCLFLLYFQMTNVLKFFCNKFSFIYVRLTAIHHVLSDVFKRLIMVFNQSYGLSIVFVLLHLDVQGMSAWDFPLNVLCVRFIPFQHLGH